MSDRLVSLGEYRFEAWVRRNKVALREQRDAGLQYPDHGEGTPCDDELITRARLGASEYLVVA